MSKLPVPKKLSDEDIGALLKDRMGEIEALLAAIVAEEPDCDLKLAELLEGETEIVRMAILEKLRERLKALADEKERELGQAKQVEKKVEVERKRGMFMQWLAWIMSEETIAKMRDAFLANSMLERIVRGVGHDMAGKGMTDIQPTDKRDLGALSQNVPNVVGRDRDKDKGTGR
jgi:hypothetical protein